MRKVVIAAMVIAVVAIVIVAALEYNQYVYYSRGGSYGNMGTITIQGNGTATIIPAGKTITITSNDMGARAGPVITSSSPIYHYVSYQLDVFGYYILTGSWHSTVSSFVEVYFNGAISMEPPTPYETQGSLKQTLETGTYYIVIGGWVGDSITMTRSIEARSYHPYVVGSFSLPSGIVITGPKTYSLYLNQSASLNGSFTVGGAFWFSVSGPYNSFSFGSYNTSAEPTTYSFNPFARNSPSIGPGLVNVTFLEGTFYINQTLEFIYFVNN